MSEMRIAEVAQRLKSLREDLDISLEEMAAATHKTVEEYRILESGTQDFSFTTLYHCAHKLGVDMVDLLTGEGPHLTGYSITRAGDGLEIKRRASFEYRHLAPVFEGRLCEPFVVTAPYLEEEQDKPIHLSLHTGQEFDYVLSGQLKFAYGTGHTEVLNPGDSILYSSGTGHGMIAVGGQDCIFLAIVLRDPHETGEEA